MCLRTITTKQTMNHQNQRTIGMMQQQQSIEKSKPVPLDRESFSSSRIRSRYLHRLGMTQGQTVATTTMLSSSIKKRTAARSACKSHPTTPTERQALKNDHGESDDSLDVHSPPLHAYSWLLSPSSSSDSDKSVSFESSVVVHSITNQKYFSERVKKFIWMQPRELEEAAARNYMEFQAEGFDWRQVTEEQEFVICQNQLIHPAHVTRECSMQRQFLKIMSAQQQHKHRYRWRKSCTLFSPIAATPSDYSIFGYWWNLCNEWQL